jgi:hypothetical protein
MYATRLSVFAMATQSIGTHHEFTTRDLLVDRVKGLRVSQHLHPDIHKLFYSGVQFLKRLEKRKKKKNDDKNEHS